MSEKTGSARSRYEAARTAFDAIFERHLDNGVEFISKDGIWIDPEVTIAPGVLILPGTILRGATVIGAGSTIGPDSLLEDVRVGENVTFNASQGRCCEIGDGATIGPWVQLRPDSVIGKNVHIGDFVEIKNSTIGEGTAVAHLTYIGDADVGKYCNFGCGVVVVNYDGEVKSRTKIGDHCFVGCNTNLVAPVRLGDGAYTAAGSTITDDLPAGALGIARARQITKEGWAASKLSAYIEKKTKLEQAAAEQQADNGK